uniref:Axonemal dynein light intermediate polypeptide 1 n=1 Tax=Gouania willdenowi TaxID=441366 RepID=A0A8C5DFN4_GOUWI
MSQPGESMLKYDNKVLIRKVKDSQDEGSFTSVPLRDEKGKQKILNDIFPPREWKEGKKVWFQQVSATPASRIEVVELKERLDRELDEKKALSWGICPVRRQVYSQCFDELIRQVILDCPDRGRLLCRVRTEQERAIAAFAHLLENFDPECVFKELKVALVWTFEFACSHRACVGFLWVLRVSPAFKNCDSFLCSDGLFCHLAVLFRLS